MDFLLDFIIVASGAYLIYTAVVMKRDGVLPPSMVSKGLDLKKAPDLPGFISYMYIKTAVLGAIGAAAGGFSLYNDQTGAAGELQFGVIAVYFAALVIYAFFISKAQKKYLLPPK